MSTEVSPTAADLIRELKAGLSSCYDGLPPQAIDELPRHLRYIAKQMELAAEVCADNPSLPELECFFKKSTLLILGMVGAANDSGEWPAGVNVPIISPVLSPLRQHDRELLQRHVKTVNGQPASDDTIQANFYYIALLRNVEIARWLADTLETRLAQSPVASQQAAPAKPRAAISQINMANRCGVSGKTIQNWDKGISPPNGYPGRTDFAAAIQFSETYKLRKESRGIARRKNHPIVGLSEDREE